MEQLQWIIFRSASGAGLLSNMTEVRLLSWQFHPLFGNLHTISRAHPQHHLEIETQRVKFRRGGCSNKEDSLFNQANKQTLIRLIYERMRERGCHVIQAEKDADVDIGRQQYQWYLSRQPTLIGDDTDILVLLLHYTPNNNAKKIYFCSDIGKPTVVYDLKVIKQVLMTKSATACFSASIHRV